MMPFPPSHAPEGDNRPADAPSSVVLVSMLAMIGASAVVALSYWLGVRWLADSALGLPAGVWVVVLLSAWIARTEQVRQRASSTRSVIDRAARTPVLPTRRGVFAAGLGAGIGRALASASGRLLDAVESFDGYLARTSLGGLGLDHQWRRSLGSRLAWLRMPGAPLRVGFAMSRHTAESLIDEDPSAAEWFVLPRAIDPLAAVAEHGLDVVVAEPAPGVLRIVTLERPGADASWFDWGQRRPLSYEAVFPLRVDPSHIHLDLSSEPDSAHTADIVADLIRAACVWSRHPSRIVLEDQFLGRRPTVDPARAGEHIELFCTRPRPVAEAMSRLAERVDRRSLSGRPTAADRAAARAVSAWLSVWDDSIHDDHRRRWIEACARVLPDEPEVMLRLAAIRLSTQDDQMGIAALRDADALLQHEGLVGADPIAFLQAELEHGPENPMTVGRVAAGLCLAIGGVPTQRLAFLQEDLMDDMRFSSWLVGRDQDRALLIRVLAELREAREPRERTGGSHGEMAGPCRQLPPARAA